MIIAYDSYWNYGNIIPPYFREASARVWRQADCLANCTSTLPLDTAVLAKYPELDRALKQMNQKYSQELLPQCPPPVDLSDCLDQYRESAIVFKVRASTAYDMSADLDAHGAGLTSLCYEGGCHTVSFNIQNASYQVQFYFR